MTSIENIWDVPATLNSPRTPRHLDTEDDDEQVQRPAKRQKQALFLSDSEDEGGDGGRMRRGAPPRVAEGGMDDDVEALFADAENDDGLSFKRIGDLDVAAMEREAEARHRKNTPLTPHPVLPSSSPAPSNGATGDGIGESRGNNKDKGKGKEQQKRSRPVLLNENLLLGPTGFPDLISQVKDFKIKGKGREIEDLTRIMRIYSFWTHKLHPKLKFRDTVERIEKLCHTKRMQVALSVWKDEAHGKIRELDADLSVDSDDEGGKSNAKAMNVRDGRQPSINTTSTEPPPLRSSLLDPDSDQEHSSLPPSSRGSSHPPTSDFPDDDDFFGPSTSSSKFNNISVPTSTTAKKKIVVDDDDEEGFWKELEVAKSLQSLQPQRNQQAAPAQSTDDLDDADLWAALEAANQPPVVPSKTGSGNVHPGAAKADGMDIDDDDMWDIVRANEQAAPALPPAVPEASGSTSEQTSIVNRSLAESEMDWDDMYAN